MKIYGRQNCINSKHHCDDMVLGIIICAYNAEIKPCTVENIIFFDFPLMTRNCITL